MIERIYYRVKLNTDQIIYSASGNEAVLIDAPAETVQGTITDAQLAKLQESDANYIMFNNEKYYYILSRLV